MSAAAPDVVITGIGMVSAAGVGVEATWKALLAGHSTARSDPRLTGLDVDIACTVPDFDPAGRLGGQWARRTDRYSQLGFLAAAEAMHQAGLDPADWDALSVAHMLLTVVGTE